MSKARTPEAMRIIQMRKQILENLNRIQVMRSVSLYRTVIGFDMDYNMDYFKRDINYLREKGYIESVDEKLGGNDKFEDKYFKLTPKGNEIALGIDSDPALEI